MIKPSPLWRVCNGQGGYKPDLTVLLHRGQGGHAPDMLYSHRTQLVHIRQEHDYPCRYLKQEQLHDVDHASRGKSQSSHL